ncbi:hypothetical protein [Maribacter sp. 2210JD10-5]|uniref:hypothetical protein n=1 Tax=Maribacter sp. 2210JD10-5 TaxID=3386272 RepID=UPI0039BC4090
MKTKDLYFPWFHLNSFNTIFSETYSVTYYTLHFVKTPSLLIYLFKVVGETGREPKKKNPQQFDLRRILAD